MTLTAECDQCQQRYRLKPEYAGRTLKCKKCGHRFQAVDVDTHEIEADESEELPRLRTVRPAKRVAKSNRITSKTNPKSTSSISKKQNAKIAKFAILVVSISVVLVLGFATFNGISSSIKERRTASQQKEALKFNGYSAVQWLRFSNASMSSHSRSDIYKARMNMPLDPSSVDTMLQALGTPGRGSNFASDYLKRFGTKDLAGQKSILVKHLTATRAPGKVLDLEPAREMSALLIGKLGADAQDIAPQIVTLIDSQIGSRTFRGRLFASLARIGGPDAETKLLAVLEDLQSDDLDRIRAIAGLGRMKTASATPTAITEYDNPDRSQDERITCLFALGRIGQPAALQKLQTVVADPSKHERDRVNAAYALGEARTDEAAQCLSQLGAKKLKDRDVKIAIIAALVAYDADPNTHNQWSLFVPVAERIELEKPNKTALQGLINILDNDDSEGIRALASQSLSGFGDAVIPIYGKLLADRSPRMRLSALRSISQLGPKAESLLPAVQDVLVNFDRQAINAQIGRQTFNLASYERELFSALYSIGQPAAPVVALGLQHNDAKIQSESIVTLMDLKTNDQRILTDIVALIGDDQSSGNKEAIQAVGQWHRDGLSVPPVTNGQLVKIIGWHPQFLGELKNQTKIPKPPAAGAGEIPPFPISQNQRKRRPTRSAEDRRDDMLSAIEWATSELKDRGAAAKEALPTLEQAQSAIETNRKALEAAPLFSIGSIKTEHGQDKLQRLQQSQGRNRSGGGVTKHGYRIVVDLQGNSEMVVYHQTSQQAQAWANTIRKAKNRLRASHQQVKQLDDSFKATIEAVK